MLNKIISLILAVFLISAFSVYASDSSDVSISVSVNQESRVISLKGFAEGTVSVTVVSGDVTFEDYTTELPKCIYFGFEDAEDGSFECVVKAPQNVAFGRYCAYVVSEESEAMAEFMLVGDVDESVLAAISSAENPYDMREKAEVQAPELGINTADSLYENFAPTAFEILYYAGRSYDSAAEFYNDYNVAAAIAKIVTSDDRQASFKANAAMAGLDYYADFANDDRLSDKAREKLFSLLADHDWKSEIEGCSSIKECFAETFGVLKALSAVQTATARVQLQIAMCEDFADIFGYVQTNPDYKMLRNPDMVFSLMLRDDLKDTGAVEEAFENAVYEIYMSENQPEKNSGGGGGGKGSVAISSSVAIQSQPPEPLSAEAEEDSILNPSQTPETVFADVAENFWAYEAISDLAELGMINGYEDNTFRADKSITRAEFAKLILSAYESVGGKAAVGGAVFSDVDGNSWYYSIADTASALGIILGSDGRFMPDESITRQDAATIIYRTLTILGNTYSKSSGFNDYSEIMDYAKDAVSLLAGAGIINGFEDSTFRPAHTLTRAQAAQLIYNIVK